MLDKGDMTADWLKTGRAELWAELDDGYNLRSAGSRSTGGVNEKTKLTKRKQYLMIKDDVDEDD